MSPCIDSDPRWNEADVIALIPQMRAFARCLRPNRNEADALAQDALATACLRAPRRDRRMDLKLWLLSLVSETFHEARRGRPWGGGGEHSLPDDLLEALALVDGAQLTEDEAAVVCGCGAAIFRRRLAGAHEALDLTTPDYRPSDPRRISDGAMAAIFACAARISRLGTA